MKSLKAIYYIIFVLLLFGFFSGIAWAIPSADFLYLETDLGGGMWQYDYTLFNMSDPIAEAGFDLYDVFFTFNPSATFTVASVPTGWDWLDGAGFAEVFSFNPGAPPAGTDIAPGTSLDDFTFLFDYQAGMLPFDVTFVNPIDPDNPAVFSSTSTSVTTPIPEPSTMFLLGAGIIGLAGLRRRFRKN
jgi:hypothetical protein